MSGEIAAAGDVMGGMLTARAVEPRAGEAAPGHAHEHGLCLNCGTALIGEHCHACGQAGHVHRTVGAIGHELLHGVFHFEGKIWRTLPMLAFRPGELTRRYVAGERARFVSPLALFLFSVFLMFAVMANLSGLNADFDLEGVTTRADFGKARANVASELLKSRADLVRDEKSLKVELAESDPDALRIAKLEKRLAETQDNIASMEQAQRFLPAPDGSAPGARSKPDNWLEAKYRHATENPKLLIYKLKSSAYKYSWALIPISLPFIWLLFPFRRGVGMYDHAVFATYSLSFMSLFAILVALLAAVGAGGPLLGMAAVLIPPLHIYKQLKGGYRLSRRGALWRTAWMLFFSVFTTTLFVLMVLSLGVAD